MRTPKLLQASVIVGGLTAGVILACSPPALLRVFGVAPEKGSYDGPNEKYQCDKDWRCRAIDPSGVLYEEGMFLGDPSKPDAKRHGVWRYYAYEGRISDVEEWENGTLLWDVELFPDGGMSLCECPKNPDCQELCKAVAQRGLW